VAVRIVTDSIADLPPQCARDLDISVVPLNVTFGSEVYRDGVDLSADQFYRKLKNSPVFPTTSTVSPSIFAEVYDKLAGEAGITTEAIVAITISARLSGTYEAALQGRTLMNAHCPVEVLDSQLATMAQGFVVMKAAAAARSGASLKEIVQIVRKNIPRAEILAAFDILEYLRRGGRIGAAKAYLGAMLHVNPLVALKDGVVKPAGRTRSRSKAIDSLCAFAGSYSYIEELAVEYTACPEDAESLIERLDAVFPKERIFRSTMTPVIGAHTGPGLLMVAILGDRK
jgi:DegV family protein with EDD domain